jgi:hypothetical protein
MTEHQSDTPAGWADLLERLGLAGAAEITYDEWRALPNERRHYLEAARDVSGARPVYLRLADPAPIAALRVVARVLDEVGDGSGDVEEALVDLRIRVLDALAEYDSVSS